MATTFIPLSGFLGAGKTTWMLAAADRLKARGLQAACIANDQGGLLIDAKSAERSGMPYGEVRGGCFCCKFDELTDTVNVLLAANRPDVVLAEAVGSCTDLAATVVRPLLALHGDRVRPRPVTSIIDPRRLEELYGGGSRFTPEIDYIFRKQLEEASFLLLNKVDTLAAPRAEALLERLRLDYPKAFVAGVSARTGEGVDAWLDAALAADASRGAALDIDYDVYAAGEAQLGWLNLSCDVGGRGFDAPTVCAALMAALREAFAEAGAEIAHLKLWAQDAAHALRMNAVRGDEPAVSDGTAPSWRTDRAAVWINARAKADETALERGALRGLERIADAFGLDVAIRELECFAPARPVPTHRMEART
ncbi:GTP-binding protein [Paenibacillus sp.]|uniref:GTP-binding protein n=1 Tax=Paenibacillus sp. TaxID=58172 RepID=UPI002D30255F|nr:GTP-binding protein [Paenibacillus sp.]HZG56040.1 GTP-binding protein [Paenibacillus sp.]